MKIKTNKTKEEIIEVIEKVFDEYEKDVEDYDRPGELSFYNAGWIDGKHFALGQLITRINS